MTGEIRTTWLSERFSRLLNKAPLIVLEEVEKTLTEASQLLEREVKERTPTSGAGTLRDSIGAMPVTVSGRSISAGAETSLYYAFPVELGSKPHWAPLLPLIDWVRRKLGKASEEAQQIAEAIRYKIAKKGTKGHFMFRDAAAAIHPQFFRMLEDALDRAEAKIEGSRV